MAAAAESSFTEEENEVNRKRETEVNGHQTGVQLSFSEDDPKYKCCCGRLHILRATQAVRLP